MTWGRAGRLAWIAPVLVVALEVVDETIQPAHVSLWLRRPG